MIDNEVISNQQNKLRCLPLSLRPSGKQNI